MKVRAILFCFCLALLRAQAQLPTSVISVTGQFTVMKMGPPPTNSIIRRVEMRRDGFVVSSVPLTHNKDEETLDPALLAISAEHIKQSLLLTLGVPDRWRGHIHVVINSARPEDSGTLLAGLRDGQQWNYDLVLPSPIKPDLLVRAVVKALLTEMANRRAGAQSAEVPDWLVAALSARLQADTFPSLVLEQQVSTFGDRVRISGLESVRARLEGKAPLSFQQLSLPDDAVEAEANYPIYAASSQLLLEKLLMTDDGPQRLRDLILNQLPAHLNWQTAFLASYNNRFHDLLDVEKWWGLTSVSFAETGVHSALDSEDTWRQMRDALDVPVEVKISPEAEAVPAELTLQEVVEQWSLTNAAPVLRRSMQDLTVLRMHCAPEFAPLIDQYRTTLENFLTETEPNRPVFDAQEISRPLASHRSFTAKELARLGQQFAALRPRSSIQPASTQIGLPTEPNSPTGVGPLRQ